MGKFAVKLQDQEGKMAEKCSFDELDLEVMGCSIRRLSTKEALEHLQGRGFKIGERSFYARKKKLKEINSNRITSAIDSILPQHFFQIDTLELIQKDHWHDLESTNDTNLRLKIKNSIRDNQLLISKYYDTVTSVIEKQIDSYRGAGLTDRLTYSDYQKVMKLNKIQSLKMELKEPQNLLFEPFEEYKANKKRIEKELKSLESEEQKIVQDNYDNQSKDG